MSEPKARSTDPETSHAAAMKANKVAPTHKQRIVFLLKQRPDAMTAWDIAEALGMRPDQVWKRVSDLQREGRIVRAGIAKNEHGNDAATWRPSYENPKQQGLI